MQERLQKWLTSAYEVVRDQGLGWIAVVVVAVVAYYLARRVVLRAVEFFIHRTRIGWDDFIVKRRVFDALAWLAPAIVVYYSAYTFGDELEGIAQRVLLAYMQIVVILVLFRVLDTLSDIYNTTPHARDVPIKGYVQVIKLAITIIGGIILFSTLLDQSPWGLLSGLGALTAVLLLIFRDTILGFVASIQIATNDMVRIGDWISFPKYEADGDVIDIALHVVKIQNWDKTITTIPTYRFIEDAFKNWRGMKESGGRRITRSVFIDMTSIRFLDEEMMSQLGKVNLLKDYLHQKTEELAAYNATHGGVEDSPLNGRRLTNLGTFRAYLVQFLRNHPQVHQDMTFLVRQHEPGPEGVGIQMYVFSRDQRWAHYENIQSDIMDHVLASLDAFGLRVFQNPTGADFRALRAP